MKLFDLHDGALYAWRDAGVRDAVLVHVDAHHDADAEEWDFVTISNFVWWALAEGVVTEVFWVVPDPTWESASSRQLIQQSVETLAHQHDEHGPVDASDRCVRALLAGRRFTACALSSLPRIDGALLDIDVDYLLVPDIAHELPAIQHAMPWIWPSDLVSSLSSAGVNPSIVTVATSTRGGFTPLEWKYLGEELCARLGGESVEGFDLLRLAAEAERRGDLDSSESACRSAIRLLPASAGARCRLARLQLLRGDDDAARRTFRDVLAHDSSYRIVDSPGRRWHAAGKTAAAAHGYHETLRMDPANPYAQLGLAQIAAASGDHVRAIAHFERSLERSDTLVDAHRGIAESLERSGDLDRAISHYERSLRLELLGHAPLDAPIATRRPRVFDGAHWEIHRRLASLRRDTRWIDALDRVRSTVS